MELRMKDLFFEDDHDFFKGYAIQKNYFIKQSQQYEIQKNDILFSEGDADKYCYYLLSGVVRVFQTADCGKELGMYIRFPGSFVDFSDLLEDLPYKNTSAQAVTAGSICVLPNPKIKEILDQEKELFKRAAAWSCRERRLLEKWCLSLASEKVPGRLLHLLSTLCRGALADAVDKIPAEPLLLPLTQTQLACMINSTQCTINPYLRQLQEEGVLELGRGRICIRNPAMLLKNSI